jgi:hypothetical protein
VSHSWGPQSTDTEPLKTGRSPSGGSKLPMTEVKGFPRGGFHPRFVHCPGRVARRQFAGAGLFCAVPGTPGRDLCRPRVRSHGEALSRPSRCDGPSHTALIQRDLPARHRHRTWRERCGVIRSAVRGLPTEARANGPVWTERTTMRQKRTRLERIASKPSPGYTAVARCASDALPPTRERMGFRASQL